MQVKILLVIYKQYKLSCSYCNSSSFNIFLETLFLFIIQLKVASKLNQIFKITDNASSN